MNQYNIKRSSSDNTNQQSDNSFEPNKFKLLRNISDSVIDTKNNIEKNIKEKIELLEQQIDEQKYYFYYKLIIMKKELKNEQNNNVSYCDENNNLLPLDYGWYDNNGNKLKPNQLN